MAAVSLAVHPLFIPRTSLVQLQKHVSYRRLSNTRTRIRENCIVAKTVALQAACRGRGRFQFLPIIIVDLRSHRVVSAAPFSPCMQDAPIKSSPSQPSIHSHLSCHGVQHCAWLLGDLLEAAHALVLLSFTLVSLRAPTNHCAR